MKNPIYGILKKNPDNREDAVTVTSGMGIFSNFIIAIIKVIVGIAANSIAIISEAVNNATDAITSVLAIVGTKLSEKKPDKKHPFGYGRIEYLTGMVISTIILVSGVELLISSVKLILEPEELSMTLTAVIIIAVSAIIKLLLGLYTVAVGKRVNSSALIALGTECRNDSFASVITIVSAIIFWIFHLSVDAYAGILTSLIIVKAGFEVLKETLAELLGRPGKKELADDLYKQIRSTPGIVSAADMILHNYGPDAYSGSVNVEIDHKTTVGEAYEILHALQLKIMHEQKVTMVFGIYAVDNESENARELRTRIASFVKSHEHIISYHAVFDDKKSNKLYCDLTVDYDFDAWDETRSEFSAYMAKAYPQKQIELTIETDYV